MSLESNKTFHEQESNNPKSRDIWKITSQVVYWISLDFFGDVSHRHCRHLVSTLRTSGNEVQLRIKSIEAQARPIRNAGW